MKLSNYNIHIKYKNDEYILYNTLNRSLVKLNKEKNSLIKNEKLENLTAKEISMLVDNGFIVEDSCDELKIYEYKRDIAKCKTKKLHVLYTITDACNSNCEYCFKKNDRLEYVEKTKKDSIKKFICNQALKKECKEIQIDFFGGEPLLLYKELIKNMEFFNIWSDKNNIEIKYRFYTNGTILNEELLEYFTRNINRIKDLQITLDGPKEIHDKVRPLKNGESSYDKIITNLRKLKSNNIPVQLRINFNSENYKQVFNCLDELKLYNLDNIPIYFYAVQAMSSSCANYELAITDKDTLKVFPILWEKAIQNDMNINLVPPPGFVYCSASCDSSFVLNYKGEVYKCALLQTNKKYKIGDISESGDLVNLSGEFYKWMCKTPLNNKKCKKCKLLPICGGGCSGSAVEKYGDYNHENCFDMNIGLVKKRIKLYYNKKFERNEKV